MRALPPLSALRHFEAAARHLSFRRAADELHVTHGAVSQQIRNLEVFLARPLFLRRARRVELTGEGLRLLEVTKAMLDRLEQAFDAIKAAPQHAMLTVCVGPYFGAHWLAPRLERFWQQHPGIDLRLRHARDLATLKRADVDIGVTWGDGNWPGLLAEPLMDARLAAVCSPALLRSLGRRSHTARLQNATLLHYRDRRHWSAWLAAAGLPAELANRGAVFEDSNVVIEAAASGQGIALGTKPLIDADLRSKRLVMACPQSLSVGETYYVVYRAAMLQQPRVKAFRSWLFKEAR